MTTPLAEKYRPLETLAAIKTALHNPVENCWKDVLREAQDDERIHLFLYLLLYKYKIIPDSVPIDYNKVAWAVHETNKKKGQFVIGRPFNWSKTTIERIYNKAIDLHKICLFCLLSFAISKREKNQRYDALVDLLVIEDIFTYLETLPISE